MTDKIQNSPIILRRREVEARTGLSRSTIYDRIRAGTFPAPVPLGNNARSVGWIESEIDAFLRGCIASRDNAIASRESIKKAKGEA